MDEGLLMKKKVEKKKPAKIAKLKPLKSKKPAIPRRQDQESTASGWKILRMALSS